LTEQEQPKKSGLSLCQFEVGRKLGKGRFGDVYMAKDIKTGFCLAIKMINKK
jgi:aurora kinase